MGQLTTTSSGLNGRGGNVGGEGGGREGEGRKRQGLRRLRLIFFNDQYPVGEY